MISSGSSRRRPSSPGSRAELAAGVKHIEVCSFVPPKNIPQFADAVEIAQASVALPGPACPSVLVPNLKGAERADRRRRCAELHFVLSASEEHNQRNVRRTDGAVDRRIPRRGGAGPGAARQGRGSAPPWRPRSAAPSPAWIDPSRVIEIAHDPGRRRVRTSCRWPTPSVTPTRPRSARLFERGAARNFGDRHPDRRPFPRHPRPRPRQRLCRGRSGRAPVRRLAGRPRRLPLRARRQRQHRHRGPGVPAGIDGPVAPASTSPAWSRCAASWPRTCPDEAMYGQIAKAGPPKGFARAA
jgi:hypothetical protein